MGENNRRRVVVTGIGVTCAIGNNTKEVLESLKKGKTGVDNITLFDSSKLHTGLYGEIKDDIVYRERDFTKKSRMEIISEKLIEQLLEDSKITVEEIEELGERTVLSMATSVGSNTHVVEYTNDIAEGKYIPERLAYFPNYLLQQYQDNMKIQGPYFVNTSACSAGTSAICTAFSKIRNGEADLGVVVGIDPSTEFSTYGFNSMKNLNAGVCTPFDKDRCGINLGEGGGILLLETYEHAKARGAKIYAEINGYGLGNDAYHRTSPDPTGEGAFRTMSMALKDAEISKDDISYINAHGTGTQLNDAMELKAMDMMFSDTDNTPVVNSTKDLTGHCLAAAGTVEAVFSVLAISEQIVFGNNHLGNPEESNAVELLEKPYEERNVDYIMSNSFAFAGNSSSIIMGKFKEEVI